MPLFIAHRSRNLDALCPPVKFTCPHLALAHQHLIKSCLLSPLQVKHPDGGFVSTYLKYMPPGIIMLIVFALAIPAFWFMAVHRNRHRLEVRLRRVGGARGCCVWVAVDHCCMEGTAANLGCRFMAGAQEGVHIRNGSTMPCT